MPKKPIDYSKTIIYKIVCNDVGIPEIYVGHTTNFKQRKRGHRSICNNKNNKIYNAYVYQFIRENGGFDNWSMIEIEKYSCNDELEAKQRERYWIEELKASLNKTIPSRTPKEYYQENKEICQMRMKEYQQVNKENISKRAKEYREGRIEQFKEYCKNYYQSHKEQVIEYRKNNKEQIALQHKEYHQRNRERILQIQKEYREKNRNELNDKKREKRLQQKQLKNDT